MDSSMNYSVNESADKVEKDVSRVVEQSKELQDSASSLISRSFNEEQSLTSACSLSLDYSIRLCRSRLDSLLSHKLLDPILADKLLEDVQRTRCIMVDGDVAAFLPTKPRGRFLKMFLGPCHVRGSRKDVQLKVKEEYTSYRDRPVLLFLLFPSALLILRAWLWSDCLPAFPVQLYQVASNVNFIMLIIIIYLIVFTRVQLFLQWAMMQGVAMLLQNRYQSQRLYTRIALGKRMDEVWDETAGVAGQLWILWPIFFVLQLLRTAVARVVVEWQVYNLYHKESGKDAVEDFATAEVALQLVVFEKQDLPLLQPQTASLFGIGLPSLLQKKKLPNGKIPYFLV